MGLITIIIIIISTIFAPAEMHLEFYSFLDYFSAFVPRAKKPKK